MNSKGTIVVLITSVLGILTVVGAYGAYAGYAGLRAVRNIESKMDASVAPANLEEGSPNLVDGLIPGSSAKTAPSISGGGNWLNSGPLSLDSLKGQVVLVDFWTFGCYNCRNTLPSLKRFDSEYRSKGLTIVGIHTPESDHESKLENVKTAIEKLGIKYPVVTDNENNIWNAYGINAWPTVVILDKQGRIRYKYVGEGAYDTQEKVIQILLAESEAKSSANMISNDEFNGERIVKSDAEWRKQLSPDQFYVLREEGTERAFSGEYADNHEDGDYYCAACRLKLFSSKTKFDSGTGWPSFYQVVSIRNVVEKVDNSFGSTRTEVECARCGSHLGHVFDDGPKPTGLRYCMNSISLRFEKR